MEDRYLSLLAMHTLLKQAGNQRISEAAKVELRDALQQRCLGISRLAMRFARHARRVTVREEDILLALEHYR